MRGYNTWKLKQRPDFTQHHMGLIPQFTYEANKALESQRENLTSEASMDCRDAMSKFSIYKPNCSVWQHKQQVALQKAIMPLLRCNKAGIHHSMKTSSTEIITKNFEIFILQSFKMFCEQQRGETQLYIELQTMRQDTS